MASSRTVHIIDDDEAVRDSLAVLLETRDVAVATYASAEEFLPQLADGVRGCVVTDMQMPGMDGLELLHAIRGRHAELPVVVMTGRAGATLAEEALRQGATAFLQKPFAPEPFLQTLRAAMVLRGED